MFVFIIELFFAVSSASFSEFDRDHKIKSWQSAVIKLDVFEEVNKRKIRVLTGLFAQSTLE
ncbi:MAG: hypothetical protein KHY32_01885 [Haemophilus parainfluenzae]|nr:hypothetical protein [Haemophilus parainfluenzae]